MKLNLNVYECIYFNHIQYYYLLLATEENDKSGKASPGFADEQIVLTVSSGTVPACKPHIFFFWVLTYSTVCMHAGKGVCK